MELYIRIIDGQPFEHPILGDNFREAFPDIDVHNLPQEFAKFERVPCPEKAKPFEKDVVTYEWVDGVVKDVWSVRPMTEEEKLEKIVYLNYGAQQFLQAMINRANEKIANTTGEEQQLWQDWLDKLNAWVLPESGNLIFPPPPFNENFVDEYLKNPGSAPNVIG